MEDHRHRVRRRHAIASRRAAPRTVLCAAVTLTVLACTLLPAATTSAASLNPSRSALMRQVRAAQAHGAYYARNEADLRTMLLSGELVRVEDSRSLALKRSIRYPYARPEVKLFLERLSQQYQSACGRKLVVTSLVRPKNHQPRNSSALSVHPTGMAMDLRRSSYRACRSWLQRVLLSLENRGLVEAAREHYPPHFHVVLFPDPYLEYLEARDEGLEVDEFRPQPLVSGGTVDYTVRRGDSLWAVARRFNTTVGALWAANGLRSNVLRPGQSLQVPVGGEAGLSVYTVRRGDSLWQIARRFGTTTLAIQQVNGLASTRIRAGQELRIPGAPGAGTGTSLATYRVRPGDNLWEIARRHGSSTREIQSVNGLHGSRIKPGQVLKIPVSGR